MIPSSSSPMNFSLLKRHIKGRWIKPLLPLSLVLVNTPRTCTQPLRELNLPLGWMRLWMWTYMVHPFLLISEVNSPFRTLTRDTILEIINLCINLTRDMSWMNIQVTQEKPSRVVSARPKKHADKRKHKVRSRYPSSSSEEDQSSVHKHRSSKPSRAPSDQDQPQHDPDPLFYREVAMADLPSQYAEEVETFRRILNLPDPRETMPRSSTSVLGLDDQNGQQELRPRGPPAMLPLHSHIKDIFDKFKYDFSASNLPEGKYIKPPPSTAT